MSYFCGAVPEKHEVKYVSTKHENLIDIHTCINALYTNFSLLCFSSSIFSDTSFFVF